MVGTNSGTRIGSVAHTEANTDSDIGFMGKAQSGSAIEPIHPEPARCSSSSRCMLSSPLGADILCNPSHHALLI